MNIITVFLQLFGRVLLWLFEFCHSYALSLAIFTLLTKLVLFPISLKGKKSMMQMNMMNGEMQRLQKQYGKDKERYQQEVSAMYEREGVNPMGGCLWSFLPLPILMGLYYIIRRPMLYMMCLTNEQITAAVDAVTKAGIDLGTNAAYQEMKLSGLMSSDTSVFHMVQTAVGDGASKLAQIDYNFIGIDLSQTPKLMFWKDGISWASIGLFLIPIVVTLLNVAYSQISQRTNAMSNNGQASSSGNAAADATTKQMMFLMPLMYLWFGYIMPAGMCVYMACSAIFMALQELICAEMLKGQFEKMKLEREKRLEEQKEKERQKKAEIAARRAAQAEENKKRSAKDKKKGSDGKSKDRPTEDSRVGMRPFARGRAYDPNRYPVTTYQGAAGTGTDAVTDAKSGTKTIEYEDAEPEVKQDTIAVESTPVVSAPDAVQAPEHADETVSLADAAFADIQKETSEGDETKD